MLVAIFALTGFSALTLQVVWQRVISLHAGVDLFSITTVVSAFLAGLGLGSLAGGVLADRLGSRRSLLAFAASEAGVGIYGVQPRSARNPHLNPPVQPNVEGDDDGLRPSPRRCRPHLTGPSRRRIRSVLGTVSAYGYGVR